MTNFLQHDFTLTDGKYNITITSTDSKATRYCLSKNGNYKLSYGNLSLGYMQFDEQMDYWFYNGKNDFTRDELITIADFIKSQQEIAA